MMADFNAEDLMNTPMRAPLDTQYIPFPEGEYRATIIKVEPRATGKGQIVMDVTWESDDPEVQAATGLERAIARQGIFLDIENGVIADGKGKNVSLGRLREAVGQNSGEDWSPAMLIGCSAVIRVAHRPDGDRTYADVKGVSSF